VHRSKQNRPQPFLRRVQQSERFLSAAGKLAARYVRFVHNTSALTSEPANLEAYLRSQHPVIAAMWHGQFLLLPTIRPADVPVKSVVAWHTDAEIIGRTLQNLDVGLIRGAGAGGLGKNRGGAQALRASLKGLKDGYSIVMTADVPPGPARIAGEGIVTMARLSGRPVLPLAIATKRFAALNTWSRFTINLPFSRLSAVAGDPIYIPRDVNAAQSEAYRLQIQNALDDVTCRAYRLAGSSAEKIAPPRSASEKPAKGLLLCTYRTLTSLARPFAGTLLRRRAKKGKELPERFAERLGRSSTNRPDGVLWWFHAASIGETNAVLPLIAEIRRRHPHIRILLTTVTVTSSQLARQRLPQGAIHQFIPLDSVVFVRRFLKHWRPDLGLFTESEIWPNLIVEAGAANIPLVLLNARMSQKSYKRWLRFSSLSRPVFSRFHLVLAQNRRIARRIRDLGAQHAMVAGNLKHDAPPPPVDSAELNDWRRQTADRPVFLAASTHPGEDEIIATVHAALKSAMPSLLTIIVPRHPERGEEVSALLQRQNLAAVRRSQGSPVALETDVYVADTIGELGLFYSLAPYAFIGGSLVNHGGQNPIEAVKLGAGVLSGPHVFNFIETYRFLNRYGGCRFVRGADDLAAVLMELFHDAQATERMKAAAKGAVANMGGAIERTLQALNVYIHAEQQFIPAPHPANAPAKDDAGLIKAGHAA
jgi:3-deoxy-D-manno-octulosonic-acid transferase